MRTLTEIDRAKVATALRDRGYRDWDIAFTVSVSDLCGISYRATGKTLTNLLENK